MEIILSISNLKKIYHTLDKEIYAVDNMNLDVCNGEFIAIVGPSGCGKSTILSILSGLDKDYCGNISIKDRVKIGYMLQQDALFEWRSILSNCLLGLEIENSLSDDSIKYVKDLLHTYGLSEFIDSNPSSLSGGMRQRVALIRTLATKPDILLLDEPFSALDYQSRLSVSDDVYNIIKNEGKTAIMVTHDIAEAISMADRVIVVTNRPAKVKKIINIKLDNKSTPINNRYDNKFKYYYDLIWKEIDHNE